MKGCPLSGLPFDQGPGILPEQVNAGWISANVVETFKALFEKVIYFSIDG